MSTLFQLGILFLFLGAVQCKEYISSDNGFMIKTYEHDVQQGDKKLITCALCQTVVDLILKSVGRNLSKPKIESALNRVCYKVRDQNACIEFVYKYKAKLVELLLSGKGAKPICRLLKLCRFFK
ncbi:prosaposin-like [Clarias gariepinus]